MTHNGYKYVEGLNFDPRPFDSDTKSTCSPGGFYFTTITDIRQYKNFGPLVQYIQVPEGIPVIQDRDQSNGIKWRSPVVICVGEPILWECTQEPSMTKFSAEDEYIIQACRWYLACGPEALRIEIGHGPLWGDLRLLIAVASGTRTNAIVSAGQVADVLDMHMNLLVDAVLEMYQDKMIDIKTYTYLSRVLVKKITSIDKNSTSNQQQQQQQQKEITNSCETCSNDGKQNELHVIPVGTGYMKAFVPLFDNKFCSIMKCLDAEIFGSFALKMLMNLQRKPITTAPRMASAGKAGTTSTGLHNKTDWEPADIDIVVSHEDYETLKTRLIPMCSSNSHGRDYRGMEEYIKAVVLFVLKDENMTKVQVIVLHSEDKFPRTPKEFLKVVPDLSFTSVSFDGEKFSFPKSANMLLADGSINMTGVLRFLPTMNNFRWRSIISLLRCIKYVSRGFSITNVQSAVEQALSTMNNKKGSTGVDDDTLETSLSLRY
jgi:hypothetical protein